jgi:AAA+ superfamily predicted ATPase
MKSSEELKTHAAAMSKAMGKETAGDSGEKITTSVVKKEAVDAIINDWGNVAKKAAENMMRKYSLPNEAMHSRLIWYKNGPWKRTIVYRDEIPHNFRMCWSR